VSLACHDLRTPLATIHGFARTVPRVTALNGQAERYLDLIASASVQMEELIGRLSTAARAEAGRLVGDAETVETLELARAASAAVSAGTADAAGSSAPVVIDRDRVVDALASIARAVLRHGGCERVSLRAAGEAVEVSPVPANVADLLAGAEPRDFEAAVALRVLEALGAGWSHERDAFVVRFRAAT
jgi:signal transduction histidine kinase